MHTLGNETTNVFAVGPEAHKLTITAQAGGTIKEGQQVVLDTDGTILAAGAAAPGYTIVGVALKDAVADDYIPVAANGFYIVEAKAAATQDAGPVQLAAYSNGVVVGAAAGGDDAAKSVVAIGFGLDAAASAGDRVRALMFR